MLLINNINPLKRSNIHLQWVDIRLKKKPLDLSFIQDQPSSINCKREWLISKRRSQVTEVHRHHTYFDDDNGDTMALIFKPVIIEI